MTIKFKTIEDRFFEKINKTESCWLWESTITRDGYGHFSSGKTKVRVLSHRFSYEFHKGKIPEGFQIDHLCRVRNCVNPEHLEAVTPRVNIARSKGVAAINSKKTHCVKDHSFEEYSYQDKNGRRICRICKKLATRERRKKYPNLPRSNYEPQKRREHYLKVRVLSGKSNRDKTHCKHGHEFTDENTYRWKNKRKCRICISSSNKSHSTTS